jgi:hypothetical protein
MSNTDLYIRSLVSDRSIIFQGYDGASNITALDLDMSNGGRATFNENVIVGGDITITGDLTVEGSTVALNTTDLNVEDKNITLNYHATADTSTSADGAGITIQDAVDASNDASILWDQSDSEFDVSHPMKIAGSVGVTNIVTNKVVKFNGTILDDSNITDDGTTITASSDFNTSGQMTFTTNNKAIRMRDSNGLYTRSMILNASDVFYIGPIDTYAGGAIIYGVSADVTDQQFYTGGTLRHITKSTGDFQWYEDNNTAGGGSPRVGMHWDYADGYLGIGDAAPEAPLFVNGNESGLADLTPVLWARSKTGASITQMNVKGDQIQFGGGSTLDTSPTMTIVYGQNKVGIGTDAPDYALQVSGSNVLSGGGLATVGIYDNGTAYNGTNPGGGITFRGKYNSSSAITNFATVQGIKENAIDGNYDTALRFTTRSNSANLTEKVRISSGGEVGIGSTDPKRPLQIGATGSFPISFNGNYPDIHMNTYYESGWRIHTAGFGAKTTFNGATGAFGFSNVDSTQVANATFTPLERLTILASGNVGIATTTPDSRFTVNVGSQGDGIELQSNETSIAKLSRTTVGSTVVASLDGVAGRPINIGGIINEDVLLATAGGSVGIGIDSPYTDLDVAGEIAMSVGNAHAVFSSDSSGKIYIKANENKVNAATAIHMQMPIISGSGTLEDKLVINHSDITAYKNVLPNANATLDLGSSTLAWRNIYTNDLHLSNEGHEEGNSVDGTKGNWTIQEGEEHLYIINNKSGKKYKFALEEIE